MTDVHRYHVQKGWHCSSLQWAAGEMAMVHTLIHTVFLRIMHTDLSHFRNIIFAPNNHKHLPG